jgi:RNA polymerase sigma-70 factor, ECF subfamily
MASGILFTGLPDFLFFSVADVERSRILGVVDYSCLHQSDAPYLSPSPASAPAVVDSEDAALARDLIAGKRSAASVAWQRYRPAVQTTLRRLLGPSEDIADLTQDVFARFFDKVDELRSLQALRPFIIGIAFRRAREEIRRRHVRRTLRPMVENHFADRPTGWDPADRQTAARLWVALERLGDDGKIYALRIIEGRELAEIAQVTNLSISTVRRRLTRVSKRMERLAANDGQAPEVITFAAAV